jgi:hypothetical protein
VNKPKLRKVNTARRKKERKATQEALKKRASMILDIPEMCCVCEGPFDKKSKEMAQTWHVVVFDNRKTIRLTCPPCWEKVENAMEETNAS